MTLLLTFEALDQGRLHIRDGVPISSHAADMMPSKLGLRPGSSIAVEDAIYIVAVHSANDIAVALAEKIGGSEPGFVAMMNRRAQPARHERTRISSTPPACTTRCRCRVRATWRSLRTTSFRRIRKYYRYFAHAEFYLSRRSSTRTTTT